MFDRIAPRYDALNRILTLGLDRHWRTLALEAVAVERGDRVVDIACGTGDLGAGAVQRGARVVGVDFAPAMLRVARRRGIGAWWVLGDAAALPVPDGWASVATCGFALRNFAALEGSLCEMARILAPAGRLAILEVDRPSQAVLRRAHSLYFDQLVPRLGGWLSDREAYRYLPDSTAYLPSADELRALLQRSGFEDVRRRVLLLGSAQLVTARRGRGRDSRGQEGRT